MKKLALPLLCLLSLTSCYHLGGMKNAKLADVDTCCVHMFTNRSFYPMAAMQVTSAVADAIETDGTFRIAAPGECDIRIEGEVTEVKASSVRTNLKDTYVSDEIQLTLTVGYTVVRNSDGRPLLSGSISETANCFNELANVAAAKEDAVSYAARRVADRIVEALTIP